MEGEMSDVIGLDLVELRAKLRGWPYEWVYEPSLGLRIDVLGPMHLLSFTRAWRYVYAYPDYAALLRPRLTLADIVAHPPERWDCAPIGVDGRCVFSQRFGNGSVEVYIGGSGPSRLMLLGDMSVLDSLAAHQAIADLLVLLGEVAP